MIFRIFQSTTSLLFQPFARSMKKHKKNLAFLRELNLTQADKAARGTTAGDVLCQLLATNVLSQEQIRSAHQTLQEQKKAKKSPAQQQQVRRRHIALRFYYDGAKYSGLAQNVGVDYDQSIERELFEALFKSRMVDSREDCAFSRCGRTDRGVSSAGQVVALRVKSAFAPDVSYDPQGTQPLETAALPKNSSDKISVWVPPKKGGPRQEKVMGEYAYDKILNNLLPDDIRILGWAPVSDEFSARFSATTRTYRYFFVQGDMDLDRMRQGLQLMVGAHDFRNFCKMDVEKVYNFERKIHQADVVVEHEAGEESVCYLRIVGQAFLWHQIRCIAAVLFLVGRGLEEPSVVTELLDVETNPGKPSYQLADEHPLVLHDCGFNDLTLGYSVPNLYLLHCHQQKQWEDLILAAARIKNCMNSLHDKDVLAKDLNDFMQERWKELSKKNHRVIEKVGTSAPVFESSSKQITWNEALNWLKNYLPRDMSVYTPLMERSMGTTYEEKVASLQNSTKRRQRYEDNVIKKRKTKEEDEAFYAHKMKQGGSAHK